MKKIISFLICAVPVFANAAPPSEREIADQYFSRTGPKLSKNEMRGLAMAQRWDNSGSMAVKPFQENDGVIRFVHGAQQASVVCAVLQVCDIQLQAGEQINNINMGDTVRWAIEPAVTGSGDGEVQHLIVKPFDERRFFGFVKSCFAHRRKSLWNNLKPLAGKDADKQVVIQNVLAELSISPQLRPEKLTLEQFITLLLYRNQ